jgi:hypothetical protein
MGFGLSLVGLRPGLGLGSDYAKACLGFGFRFGAKFMWIGSSCLCLWAFLLGLGSNKLTPLNPSFSITLIAPKFLFLPFFS